MEYGKFCLKCRKPNMGCKCGTDKYTFCYSDKLRVPLEWKKRANFRRFLEACPIFVNGVTDELKPMFREFLRDIKCFEKKINGYDWTYVHKNKEEADEYFRRSKERMKARADLKLAITNKKEEFEKFVELWDDTLYNGTQEEMEEMIEGLNSSELALMG